MEVLKENIQVVLDYVTTNCTDSYIIRQTTRCFEELQQLLEQNDQKFTIDKTDWFDLSCFNETKQKIYKRSIRQLRDVYLYGTISFRNRFRVPIPEELNFIQTYLDEKEHLYTEKHKLNIVRRCNAFLRYLYMERNIHVPQDITYEDILVYYDEQLQSMAKTSIVNIKPVLFHYLSWMNEQHLCTAGFSLVFYYLNRNRILDMSLIAVQEKAIMDELGSASYSLIPPEKVYLEILPFLSHLKEAGYEKTMMITARAVTEALFLFLDMNSYGYDTALVWKWFELAGTLFKKNILTAQRCLSLFNDWIMTGKVDFKKVYLFKEPTINSFPDWCRTVICEFTELKKREGKKKSTVDMYRSSAMRFCRFLCENGIESFNQLETEHIKQFNLSDRHKTTEGKNAYNIKIRKFLLYLAEKELIQSRFMAFSLICVSAPKTRIVKVLSQNEITFLEEFGFEQDPSLRLRNRAMLLIGLRMGLRASDVVSLQLEQIDWKRQCICFVQDKTDVEKLLPMPVSVGNAIYLYLTQGRPKSSSQFVFITHKAPYERISDSVCQDILIKAFPDPSTRPGGFHITRKTYATERFRNACGVSVVADLLGHTDTNTVHKYISLDEERMHFCPISLHNAGIPFIGGFVE